MGLDALDPFNVKRQFDRVTSLRDTAAGLTVRASDIDFLRNARRALFPLPVVDRAQPVPAHVFPPFEPRPIPSLRGKRVGFVGSGGSGASVALVGVARAFEEAGVRPDAISACSGSAIWGSMWAAGLSADEMAEFSLAWRPQDYLDIQWLRLPRFALSALRGFTGLAKGEALERLFDRRLWHMTAGETEIPLHTIVYNMDRGRLEYFGSEDTPPSPSASWCGSRSPSRFSWRRSGSRATSTWTAASWTRFRRSRWSTRARRAASITSSA
jgi:NTE family protein